jgi:hypothetical protein
VIKRKGWVSNSSSSSFICDVCGDAESGWDACVSDFGMTRFYCDHIVCDSEWSMDIDNLTFDQKKQLVDDNDRYSVEDKFEKQLFEGRYGSDLSEAEQVILKEAIKAEFDKRTKEYYEDIDYEELIEGFDETPRTFCPICNLETISDKTILRYIVNTHNISIIEVEDIIRDKFKTLDEVKESLK